LGRTIFVTSPKYGTDNISQARPSWCLGADAVIKVNGVWGQNFPNRSLPFSNLPPHHGKTLVPLGGNELFADGSVQWIAECVDEFVPRTGATVGLDE
jgi:hypothetical protein